VIGFGQLTLWPKCAELSDLVIAAPYRGNGLGTTLVQYLARTAREMHATCLEIGAAYSNPQALALYRHLGFQDQRTLQLDLGDGNEAVLFLRLDMPKSR
jgi:ribosomal protein S18 acetylase RimI-like enzyme